MNSVLGVQQRNEQMSPPTPEPTVSIPDASNQSAVAITRSKDATNGVDKLVIMNPKVNNGARGRRERPCDACRRRKSRCVMNEGAIVCVLCDFHHQECTFVQSPQPRKRKTPASQSTDTARRRRSPIQSGGNGGVGGDINRQPPTATESPIVQSTSTHATVIHPIFESQDTPTDTTAFEGETLGLQMSKTSRYFGFTTPHDPLLLSFTTFTKGDEAMFPTIGTLRRVGDHTCFIMQPDEGTGDASAGTISAASVDQRLYRETEALVHPYGISGNRTLIDIYFRAVHNQFPVVHKQWFMTVINTDDMMVSPAMITAIYLIALTWWNNQTYNPDFFTQPCPNTDSLKSATLRALSTAMNRPRLSTIQAGLILLQKLELSGMTAASGLNIPLSTNKTGESTFKSGGNQGSFDGWLLSTQLLAIGQELGLHLDCTQWDIPSWEKGLRRRIAWALYMQDKWSCLIYGRPSHIVESDWVVKPLCPDDFTEKECTFMLGDNTALTSRPPQILNAAQEADDVEEVSKGQCLFVEMVNLTMIMSDILDLFYTQRAIRMLQIPGPNQIRLVLDRAKSVQIRLKEWYTSLPPLIRMDNVKNGVLCSTGSLHLAYFAIEITLHRRIVQSLSVVVPVKTELDSTPANQPTPPPSIEPAQPAGLMTIVSVADPYISHICRSAAKTRLISALDFANRLKPEHLKSFWYFSSAINFGLIATFGCLLWATSPAFEEAEFYRARLTEFRWTLSVSRPKLSGPVSWLDVAIQILDTNRVALECSLASKLPVADLVGGMQVPIHNSAQPQGFRFRGFTTEPSPSFSGNSDELASSNAVEPIGSQWHRAGRLPVGLEGRSKPGSTIGRRMPGYYEWGSAADSRGMNIGEGYEPNQRIRIGMMDQLSVGEMRDNPGDDMDEYDGNSGDDDDDDGGDGDGDGDDDDDDLEDDDGDGDEYDERMGEFEDFEGLHVGRGNYREIPNRGMSRR